MCKAGLDGCNFKTFDFICDFKSMQELSDRIFIDLEIVRFFKATSTCIFMSMKNIRARELQWVDVICQILFPFFFP
jgi:hypothetical protein